MCYTVSSALIGVSFPSTKLTGLVPWYLSEVAVDSETSVRSEPDPSPGDNTSLSVSSNIVSSELETSVVYSLEMVVGTSSVVCAVLVGFGSTSGLFSLLRSVRPIVVVFPTGLLTFGVLSVVA